MYLKFIIPLQWVYFLQICQGNDAATELHLARTVLERLECSFARQEAKLDKILNLMASFPATSLQHQTSQCAPPLRFSTPDPRLSQSLEYPVEVQSVQRNAEYSVQVQSLQRTPLADVDMLLNTELTGILLSFLGYQRYHSMPVLMRRDNTNDKTLKSTCGLFTFKKFKLIWTVDVIMLIFIYHSCRYGWNWWMWKCTARKKWLHFCQSSIKTIRDGSPLGRQAIF